VSHSSQVGHLAQPSFGRGKCPSFIQPYRRSANPLTGSHFGSRHPRIPELPYLPRCQQFQAVFVNHKSLACRFAFLLAAAFSREWNRRSKRSNVTATPDQKRNAERMQPMNLIHTRLYLICPPAVDHIQSFDMGCGWRASEFLYLCRSGGGGSDS